MYFSVEASYQEIELNLIEQKRTESRKDNVLDPPFPSFECHEEESGSDGYSGHDTPAQIGIIAGIEPEECVRIDILHGRHHSRHQRHASEKDKYRDHVALGECLKTDVGVAYRRGALETHGQQYYGKDDCRTYLLTVEPVVVLAVDTDEDDAEQPQAPQDASEIVDPLERDVGSLSVSAPHAEVYQREYDDECPNRETVHRPPVEGRNAVSGHNVGQLHTAENNRKQEREEDCEITVGCNAQLQVAPADEPPTYIRPRTACI